MTSKDLKGQMAKAHAEVEAWPEEKRNRLRGEVSSQGNEIGELVAMARAAEKDDRLSDGALYGKLAAALDALVKERDGLAQRVREQDALICLDLREVGASLVVFDEQAKEDQETIAALRAEKEKLSADLQVLRSTHSTTIEQMQFYHDQSLKLRAALEAIAKGQWATKKYRRDGSKIRSVNEFANAALATPEAEGPQLEPGYN